MTQSQCEHWRPVPSAGEPSRSRSDMARTRTPARPETLSSRSEAEVRGSLCELRRLKINYFDQASLGRTDGSQLSPATNGVAPAAGAGGRAGPGPDGRRGGAAGVTLNVTLKDQCEVSSRYFCRQLRTETRQRLLK